MASKSSDLDDLAASLGSQWKPNATKSDTNDKPGTGKAVHNTGLLTPEGTPEVDDGRIEAEKQRQTELRAAKAAKKSSNSQSSKGKKPQSSNESGDVETDDEEAAKQAKILKEILSCGQDEPHKILGIPELYNTGEEEIATIEKAVYDRGIEVHPRYNKGENAEKAWNMIRTAGEELGCNESVYQEVLEFGDENPDMPEDDSSSMEDVQNALPKPSKIILGWYEEVTPLMNQLQQNPKSFSAKKRIGAINDKIKMKNEEENQEDTSMWLVDYKVISQFYQNVRPFVDRLKENANDQEAEKGAQGVQRDLNDYLDKNHYPRTWSFQKNLLMREAENSTRTRQPKQSSSTTRTEQPKQASSSKTDEQPKQTSSSVLTGWSPGLTTKGEKIYAMQPYERTSKVTQEKSMYQCYFLIEKKAQKKGKKSMVFEDSETIGTKATEGYLKQLPEGERVDIRTEKYKYSTADKMGFIEIDDIAVKDGYSERVYPQTCLRVKYDDGTYKYPNRSVFRKIWGELRADRMIEDFYNDKGLTIPWKKRVKRPGVVESTEVLEKTNSAATMENPNRGRTTSMSLGRRRSSVSSSSSYLSDEGVERLGSIEDRMDKFEQNFEKLMNMVRELKKD